MAAVAILPPHSIMQSNTVILQPTVQLVLLKQSSLCEEVITSKNGEQRTLHIIVKNSPFNVTFGFVQQSSKGIEICHSNGIDPQQTNVITMLMYDANPDKEVDFVKEKPLVVKPTINQNGTKISVEARIKVLTSQLEDSLFRLCLTLTDSVGNEQFKVFSDPIKVISKSDQVKKKKIKETIIQSSCAQAEPVESDSKKRSLADLIGDQLEKIEEREKYQQVLLEKLIQSNETFTHELASYKQQHSDSFLMNLMGLDEPMYVPVDISSAFKDVLNAYDKLNHVDKKRKLGNCLAKFGHQLTEMAEFADLCHAEGIPRKQNAPLDNFTNNNTNNNNACTEEPRGLLTNTLGSNPVKGVCSCADCPHKRELVRIENFYEDIFALSPP